MGVKQYVLNELAKLQLGVEVLNLEIEPGSIIFTVGIDGTVIEFLVNDENQFQIRSATYNEQKHTELEFLNQFNEFVAGIIPIIKPATIQKINDFSKPKPALTIEERERQVTQKEEQLKKRALAIQARARLLEFQMQAVDVESHFFEELKDEQLEVGDIKDWLKKGRFIFEWIIMIVIALLIVAFLIMNTR